ncbi:uncharacterized protein DS421_6g178710 [Arachis hypogaea]|nr:uncharacterized protein DS421_6g178710 [Arachis hypogaea]
MTLKGKRVPNLTTSWLQLFLVQKKKSDKYGGVYGVIRETGADAAQSSARPIPSPKRKMLEYEKSLEILSEEELDAGTGGKHVFEKQKKLHGFIEGVNAQSLWSDVSDVWMVKLVGKEGIMKYMQVNFI